MRNIKEKIQWKRIVALMLAVFLAVTSYNGNWSVLGLKAYAVDSQEQEKEVTVTVTGIPDSEIENVKSGNWLLKSNQQIYKGKLENADTFTGSEAQVVFTGADSVTASDTVAFYYTADTTQSEVYKGWENAVTVSGQTNTAQFKTKTEDTGITADYSEYKKLEITVKDNDDFGLNKEDFSLKAVENGNDTQTQELLFLSADEQGAAVTYGALLAFDADKTYTVKTEIKNTDFEDNISESIEINSTFVKDVTRTVTAQRKTGTYGIKVQNTDNETIGQAEVVLKYNKADRTQAQITAVYDDSKAAYVCEVKYGISYQTEVTYSDYKMQDELKEEVKAGQNAAGKDSETVVMVKSTSSGTEDTTKPDMQVAVKGLDADNAEQDKAGWSYKKQVTVTAADSESGVAGIYYIKNSNLPEGLDKDNITKENLTAENGFTSAVLTEENGTSKTDIVFEEEGTYYIYGTDVVGNTAFKEVIVEKIDKVNPVISDVRVLADNQKIDMDTATGSYYVTSGSFQIQVTAQDSESGLAENADAVVLKNNVVDLNLTAQYRDGSYFIYSNTSLDEGTYAVKYQLRDNVGNLTDEYTVTVVVDKTAPVIKDMTVKSIVDGASAGKQYEDGGITYFQSGIEVSFKVEEQNTAAVQAVLKDDTDTEIAGFSLADNSILYNAEEDTYTFRYDTREVENAYVEVYAQDKAGLTGPKVNSIRFTLDKSAPVISYSSMVSSYYGEYRGQGDKNNAFSIFAKRSNLKLVFKIMDNIGVQSFTVRINGVEKEFAYDTAEKDSNTRLVTVPFDGNWEAKGYLGTIEATAYDKSGQAGSLSDEIRLTAVGENAAPQINITEPDGFYNKKLPVRAEITSASGIKKVSVEVAGDEEFKNVLHTEVLKENLSPYDTQDKLYTAEEISVDVDISGIDLTDTTEKLYARVIVTEWLNNQNQEEVTTASAPVEYRIDLVQPKIKELKAQTASGIRQDTQGRYYANEQVQLSFKVTDQNLDLNGMPQQVEIPVTFDDGTSVKVVFTKSDETSEEVLYKADYLPEHTDGTAGFTFKVGAGIFVDKAGNVNEASEESPVVVADTKNPEITDITVEKSETTANGRTDEDNKYYANGSVKLSFKVTDVNLGTMPEQAEIPVVLKSSTGETQKTVTFTKSTETAGEVTYQADYLQENTDGTTEFAFRVAEGTFTDKAGNPNTASQVSQTVVVDTKNPEIADVTILSLHDENAAVEGSVVYYDDDIKVSVNIEDSTLRTYKIEVIDTKEKSWDITDKFRKNADSTGAYTAVLEEADILTQFERQGTLKVRVTAQDKAENVTQKVSAGFVIEKAAPVIGAIKADKQQAGIKENQYHLYGEQITVEASVTDRSSMNIQMIVYKDGQTEPYQQVSVTKEAQSKSDTYSYTGKPACVIKEDGDYRVVVTAVDVLGEKSEQTEYFTVDKTAPAVTVTYLSDDYAAKDDSGMNYYATDRTATIVIRELSWNNNDVNIVNIKKAGEIIQQIPAKDFTKKEAVQNTDGNSYYEYTYSYEFKEDALYEISVTASDLAGNHNKTAVDSIVSEFTDSFVIDKTAPDITVTYADQGAYAGKDNAGIEYYAAGRTADIVIRELSWDDNAENVITVNKTIPGENGNTTEQITVPAKAFNKGTAVQSKDGNTYYEYTYRCELTDDAEYEFFVTGTDILGNHNKTAVNHIVSEYTSHFVVDMVNPVVSEITVTPAAQTHKYTNGGVDYYDGQVDISFEIQEYYPESYVVRIDGAEINAQFITEEKVQNGRMKYTLSYGNEMHVSENAHVEVLATDKAKRTGSRATADFCIDNENPYITEAFTYTANIGMENQKDGRLKQKGAGAAYHIFSMGQLNISLTVNDDNSGIDRLEYTTQPGQQEAYVMTAAQAYSTEQGLVFTIPVAPEYKNTVSVKVYDKAGRLVTDTTEGIIAESQNMHSASYSGEIVANNQPNGNGFYNSDISLTLNTAEKYSGIQEVAYQMGSQIDRVDKVVQNRADEDVYEWSHTETILAESNNTNDVHAEFTLTDNTGRKQRESQDYQIDITKPVISVEYDTDNAVNEKYYNTNRTATITISERNFSNDGVRLVITRNGSTVEAAPAFTTNGVEQTAEDGSVTYTWAMDYTFTEDGDYTFTVECTDLADNTADYSRVDEFTIDQTLPVISMELTGTSSEGNEYYSEVRTAMITVEEHNFNEADFQLHLTASDNGVEIAAPSISAFSDNGDTHTATIVFDRDEEITISADYTDMAGNAAETLAEQKFVIDLTDPVIEIDASSLVENKTYGKAETVTPQILITDTNFTQNGVSIQVEGRKNGVIQAVISSDTVANGLLYTVSGIDEDDVYMLTVQVTDMSGRVQQYQRAFHVNKNGSSYAFGNALQTMNKTYVKAVGEDLYVVETNVDALTANSVTYSRGGMIAQLQPESDYSLSVSENAYGWQEYTYRINQSVFKEEGEYKVNISSTDVAGNSSDNSSKEQAISFVVDNTPPTQVVTGVQNGGVYTQDSLNVTIEVYDNIAVNTVDVSLNGNKTTYNEEQLSKENGKVYVNVPSDTKTQSLEVTCVDYAGNRAEQQNYSFTVSTNAFITFKARYLSKPGFWIGTGCIAVLLGGGIAGTVFFRRRKKQEQ